MKNINFRLTDYVKYLSGDMPIWALLAVFSITSCLPVFSSLSNQEYSMNHGTVAGSSLEHIIFLFVGFVLAFLIHRVSYKSFGRLATYIGMPFLIGLLVFTLFNSTIIQGVYANRWIDIPLLGKTFQTSILASLILPLYTVNYLIDYKNQKDSLKKSILRYWVVVFMVIGLILPADLSTGIILFSVVLLICYIGGYPLKWLATIVLLILLLFSFFVITVKAFDFGFESKVNTWESRIKTYFSSSESIAFDDEKYQIRQAKIAMVNGGWSGVGSGDSLMKNKIPHSSTDYIYAVIVEEYGLLFGTIPLFVLYFLLLVRLTKMIIKAKTLYPKLILIAIGVPIVIHAIINMLVVVDVLPVTGQNLPFYTTGGTSILITFIAFGIIQSTCRGINNQDVEEKDIEEDFSFEKFKDTQLSELLNGQT